MWIPIKVDDYAGKDLEGLVGIEECINYDPGAVSKFSKRKHKTKKDNSSKIKRTKSNESVDKWKRKSFDNDSFCPSVFGSTMEKINGKNNKTERDNVNYIELKAWNNVGLPESILQGLQELKFMEPTQIQLLTLPAAILGRRDILGASETGSGKTLAFGLPILTGIIEIENQATKKDIKEDNRRISIKNKKEVTSKPLYALILTPTRELAIQIKNHLESVAKYTGIKITAIVGGMAAVKQERLLREGPEIVVATPGRLWELIQLGNSHLSQLDTIRYLVIDETDRMLEKGHFQELHDLLEKLNLNETKKSQRQNFVFSATLTLVHELPNYLRYKIKKSKKIEDMTPAQKLKKIVDMLGITDPKVVDISQGTGTSATLTECKISCDITEKDYHVYYFLKRHPGKTLIFCNSIGCVRRLCTLLNLLGCHPLPLHASMQQRQRLKSIESFRDIDNSILIATDVAARGLDIPCVEHVLHYQTPRTSESYIHRSGRTARASRQGITILLIEPNELQSYMKICTTLGKDKDLPTFPVQKNFLDGVKQRVSLAREIDKLQLQVRKTNAETGWYQKMAEDMDIIIDVNKKYDTQEAKRSKEIANLKRKQLVALLAKPIFPVGFGKGFSMNTMAIEKLCEEEKAIDIMKNAGNFNNQRNFKSLYILKKKSLGNISRNMLHKHSSNIKRKKSKRKS